MPKMSNLRQSVYEALLISALGIALGLLLNRQLLWNVLADQNAVIPVQTETDKRLVPVALDETRELIEKGAFLIDARPIEFYREGHIAGALPLPLSTPDGDIKGFRSRVPANATVIVYCDGYDCNDSNLLGLKLLAAGYREVLIYEGGFSEWEEENLPVHKGDTP